MADDAADIMATVMDYWEGWFLGDAERMQRALHPDFAKTGVGIDEAGQPTNASMTAPDMVGWTSAGQGQQESTVDFTAEVTIDDQYHHIATVTVRSGIYREYLHVMHTADGWKLPHALYMRVR